jgi:hypothetical protein
MPTVVARHRIVWERGLQNRGWECVILRLQQEPKTARDSGSIQVFKSIAVKVHRPIAGFSQTRQRMQGQCLANSVWTQHANELAWRQAQVQIFN